MKSGTSFISTGLFVLVLFCFFLPFADFRCNNTIIGQTTGKELITGTHIKTPAEKTNQASSSNNNESVQDGGDYIKPNGWVIAAFAFAIAGLLMGVIIRQQKTWWHLLFSMAGLISLIGFQIQSNSRFNEESNGALLKLDVHIDYLWGYWLSLILFGLIAGNSLFTLFMSRIPPAIKPEE